MANIKITKTFIDGLVIVEPTVFEDKTGYLFETYNTDLFNEHNLNLCFVQDNEVESKKGVLRGMHVNIKHPQGKIIRVLEGKIFDVVIDLRKDSKTFLKQFAIELSDENRKQLYIPEGMGHGYYALTDTRVLFKTTTHYIPNDEVGFAWNSDIFKIEWPVIENQLIQSKKDKENPKFSLRNLGE